MKLLTLIAHYLVDFIRANATIARQVFSRKIAITPRTIEVPTAADQPLEILALSNLITFTPGTLVLDFEPGERMRVHVLDDAPAAGQAVRERLEKPLLEITRP